MCALFCYPLPKHAPTIAFCTASDAKMGWGLRTRLVINVIWHHGEECFAVKLGICFQVHILSGSFIIETEHHSLEWLERQHLPLPSVLLVTSLLSMYLELIMQMPMHFFCLIDLQLVNF